MTKIPSPPKLVLRFFRWFCHPDLVKYIEGDLIELLEERVKEKGAWKAKWLFVWDVVKLIRPSIIKPTDGTYRLNNYGMFKNNLKIAWRNLVKQKMYTAIKIGSFAIGVSACLLITLFIKNELSYDTHFPEKERIYRLVEEYNFKGRHGFHASFSAPYAQALKDEFPEIEKAGRINNSSLSGAGGNEVRRVDRGRSTHEEKIVYMDQELLEIFEPKMIQGSLKQALREPNTIVISESKAKQYFPEGGALNKTLILNNDTKSPYRIGGVIEDFPSNCHLQYDFLITLTGKEFWKGEQRAWLSPNYFTYIKLKPNANVEDLEVKLGMVMEKYLVPVLKGIGNSNADKIIETTTHSLQPITDIHLKSSHIQDNMVHGNIRLVWLFGGIAGFILLLASINFINLSTAKSTNRAKEVGLRKTLGSLRSNLILQFLTESILFSLVSFIIGIVLTWILLPSFNEILSKDLILQSVDGWLIPIALLLACFGGLLSGLYPAFYLSAFKPIQVLKGNLGRGSKKSNFRSGLVIFQFTTSIILIISTMVIYGQMSYILNKEVGFEKEQVILIHGASTLSDKTDAFKNELKRLSGVANVSVSDYLPVDGSEVKRNGNTFWERGKSRDKYGVKGQLWGVDCDYINTMGMNILYGEDFSIDVEQNRKKVIINETMARRLSLEEPIGKTLQNTSNQNNTLEIIGVVEDFHFQSFKNDITPLCLVVKNSPSIVAVKTSTENMSGLLLSIGFVWDSFSPNQSMRYSFLDERFATMHQDIKRAGIIFGSFSALAIFVACLGLFALSAFTVEQKSKEMSIRKVLGASTARIFGLLTFNFLKLILISMFIAGPLAWYFMQIWLNDFAYRIDIAWWFFAIAGVMTLVIVLITITGQALKVSFSNPVDYLKDE